MRRIFLFGIAALVALAGAVPAQATSACFDWDCDWETLTCDFDASCSSASPFVWFYFWSWGDGTGGSMTGSSTISHTFNQPHNECIYDVTLTVTPYGTDPADSVTCEVWFTLCPVGPQQEEEIHGHGHCE